MSMTSEQRKILNAGIKQRRREVARIEKLSDNCVELLRLYAVDAANWSGTPIVNANVTLLGEKEDCGLLVHLKRAGLIKTISDRERMNGRITVTTTLTFTEEGIRYIERKLNLVAQRSVFGVYAFTKKEG